MSQGWRHYPYASLVKMSDGDTCEVRIDHGFTIEQRISVRLFGIHCPEREQGLSVLKAANEFIWRESADSRVSCQLWTWRMSFTRYVGRVQLAHSGDLSRSLIGLGLGVVWDGQSERPPFPAQPNVELELSLYDGLLKAAGQRG